jgi:hypothetical protein
MVSVLGSLMVALGMGDFVALSMRWPVRAPVCWASTGRAARRRRAGRVMGLL